MTTLPKTDVEKFKVLAQRVIDRSMELLEDDLAELCHAEGIRVSDEGSNPDHWILVDENVTFEIVPPKLRAVRS